MIDYSRPDLRHFTEWIDLQSRSTPQATRRGIFLGLGLSVLWLLFPVALIALNDSPRFSGGPSVLLTLLPCLLLTGAFIGAYFLFRTKEEKQTDRARKQIQGIYWRLFFARWSGTLASALSAERAECLERGAAAFIECRSATQTSGWQDVDKSSPWYQARIDIESAMSQAMTRLVGMVGGTNAAIDPGVTRLLADMTAIAEEAKSSAARLSAQRGLPSETSDLRKALSQLEALNRADDEVGHLTH